GGGVDNTGEGGDSGNDGDGIGGGSGKGIWGGDEDHGDSGDAGGEDIASNLATSESDQAGTDNGSGMVILAVIRQELGAPPRQSQHPSRHPHPPHQPLLDIRKRLGHPVYFTVSYSS
ncbi:hypothetical protein Tco_0395690, partial [Tanacetum coccineum]